MTFNNHSLKFGLNSEIIIWVTCASAVINMPELALDRTLVYYSVGSEVKLAVVSMKEED